MKKISIINKMTSSWLEPINLEEQHVLSWREKDYEIRSWNKSTGNIGAEISFDIETELVDNSNPKHSPKVVLAVAFNGDTLYRIAAKDLKDFIEAHQKSTFICHNAAFDILHTGNHIGDLTFKYKTAEEERIYDTFILSRLINLAKHGECRPIKGKYSLQELSKAYLGLNLPKEVSVHGEVVRLSYGNFLGKNLDIIPAAYWYYCCWDTLSTFFLWQKLEQEAQDLSKQNCVDPKQLLSHFIQVKAQIALNLLNKEGIGLDEAKVSESKIKLEKKIIRLDKELKDEFDYVGGLGKRERFNTVCANIEEKYNIDLPKIVHKATGNETFSQSKILLQEFSHIPFF